MSLSFTKEKVLENVKPSYQMLIGGEWVDSRSRRTIPTVSPATAEVISYLQMASKEDVDLAVKAACEAFPPLEQHVSAGTSARVAVDSRFT
tara:strand:+ start:52977 stop:53249 length:273 start_codon:yes stop_codon:yes gene_type:complete